VLDALLLSLLFCSCHRVRDEAQSARIRSRQRRPSWRRSRSQPRTIGFALPWIDPTSATLDEADEALKRADYPTARARVGEATAALLAQSEPDQDDEWLKLLDRAGRFAWRAQDVGMARTTFQRVFDIRSKTLAPDDAVLLSTQDNLALAMQELGELEGARDLQEHALAIRTRTLPDDDRNIQLARATWLSPSRIRRPRGARSLEEKVLEVRARTLPEDDLDVQRARVNLGGTLYLDRDFAGARVLFEEALAGLARTLPEDHPLLQPARNNVAATMRSSVTSRSTLTLREGAGGRSADIPRRSSIPSAVRGNLAITLRELVDPRRRASLGGKVLSILADAARKRSRLATRATSLRRRSRSWAISKARRSSSSKYSNPARKPCPRTTQKPCGHGAILPPLCPTEEIFWQPARCRRRSWRPIRAHCLMITLSSSWRERTSLHGESAR
jgi:tetratricopeptide (TPR) repeat protein